MVRAPAEFLEFRGGVLRPGINKIMGAQLVGQCFFFFAATDRHGAIAKFPGKLDRQVPQAAQSMDRHQVTRQRSAVVQGGKGGPATAQQRSSLDRGQFLRDDCQPP